MRPSVLRWANFEYRCQVRVPGPGLVSFIVGVSGKPESASRMTSRHSPLPTMAVLTCAALLTGAPLCAQQNRAASRSASDVLVFVEPIAAGLQYAWTTRAGLRLGAALTAGPQFGVDVADASAELRSWANVQSLLAYRFPNGIEAFVSPVGAALVVGDDFGAVYPSAQIGVEFGGLRTRFGSILRIIRIAGPDGTGDYWTQWIPIRIAYSIGR